MKHLLFCLFMLLTTDIAFAQNDISGYSLRHFTSENGLSQNTVKSIAPDDYGFIWLATESGMLRFDGSNFKQFDKNNTGILTSRMFDIRRNQNGKELLAVSSAGDLLLILKGKAKKCEACFDDMFLPKAVKALKLGPVNWSHRHSGIDSLLFYPDEHLVVLITRQYGITWYTDKGTVRHTSLPVIKETDEIFPAGNAVYRAAAKLAGDTLQRITPEGIARVPLTGDLIRLPGRNGQNCLVESYPGTGQTFLYSGRYLYFITPLPDGSINTQLLLSGFDLVNHHICCAYYDSLHQRIFMGSLTEGLYVLDRKKFQVAVYQGKDAYPLVNVIYDHVVFNDSCVLTGSGTIFCTNPAQKPMYKALPGYINNNKDDHYTNPVFRSRGGNIWVCGPDSLYLFDGTGTRKIKEWKCTMSKTLTESRDGRIWIGTDRSGLYVLDPDKPHSEPQLLHATQGRIMSIEWEGAQWLWICTIHHLLRMNAGTGVIDTIAGLTGKMARGLYIPRQGEVWICTYEDGLFLWQNGRLTHFPTQNYPYLKTIHKILEDEQGFFWISTNHGIYQARRQDLLAYANSHNGQDKPYLYYYSWESGFLTNEFNGGSQYVGTKLANGFFSLSSMNGVVFFKPSDIKSELPEGKIIIDKLEVDGREISMGNAPVALPRNFRTLTITPVSAYMGNAANLKYEFRLNDDVDWRSTYNGAVVLSSLPAGYNSIFIRKKTGFGNGSRIDSKLILYVPPAWWQTRWFYGSVVAGIILLTWLIIRVRVRRWKKRNRVLEAAVQSRTQDLKNIIHDLESSENRLGEQLHFQRTLNENITHDITTPLKYLTIFTGNVLTRASENSAPLLTDIEHIHQGANQIYNVVQNLSQYMHTRLSQNVSSTRFYVYNLVAQKAELFKIAAAERNNQIQNNADPALIIKQNESLISIILHNLIDNAIKHTENGKIIINTATENGIVTLSITDTGKGMAPTHIRAYNDYFGEQQPGNNKLSTGFGFLIIKEIATLLKLEISVKSEPGKGIQFLVVIPPNEP